MPEKPPKRRWSMPGCRGRFFVRGKKNIIQYKVDGKYFSTGLPYSPENKIITAKIIKEKENPVLTFNTKYIPNTIGEAYDIFHESNKKNKKKTTWRRYEFALKFFFKGIEPLNDYEGNKAIIYEKIANTDRLPRTINSHLRHLKAFFNFCIEQGYIEKSPITKGMFIKTPDKLIDTWTDDEMKKIFEYWELLDDEYHLFLQFLYKTAFRSNEAINLTRSQVHDGSNFRNAILLDRSKYGDRTEGFPLSEAIIGIIEELPNWIAQQEKLFRWETTGILRRKLYQSMKELNIPKKTTNQEGTGRGLHTFRKTRITEWIVKDNLDFLTVVKLSRDSIATVKKYYANLKTADYRKFVK